MPQAMHYNEYGISDTKNLPTNTADIPHWAKTAQYQTACFGSNSLRAGVCLAYPTWAGMSQLGPTDARGAEGSWGRIRDRDIPGAVIQSTQQEPRGAGDKGSGRVWEVSFPPRIISHKLCQLSTVKQILEISINISHLEGEAAPITFGFVVLGAATVSERRLPGIFLIARRRKFPLKTNTHSPACNAALGQTQSFASFWMLMWDNAMPRVYLDLLGWPGTPKQQQITESWDH